jgi:hypothetical protein
MGMAFGTYGGEEKCLQVFVTKSEGKRPLGWEDNIDMDLQEIGCVGVNCVGLLQNGDK